MNHKTIIILMLVLGVFFNNQLLAQRNHGKGNKKVVKTTRVHNNNKVVKTTRVRSNKAGGANRKVTVVNARRFPRNKVIVVKQRRVRAVTVLPAGYTTIAFRSRNYYYHSGYFYNYVGATYTLIAPPIGIRVKLLPVGYRKIFIGGVYHYYYMGACYRQINDEYEVIEPTVGTIVPELPEDNVEEVTIDGNTYYEYDNLLYKSVVTETGVQYEVVGKLDD